MKRSTVLLASLLVTALLASRTMVAQPKPPAAAPKSVPQRNGNRTTDEEAIRQMAAEFVQAFNKADSKAIAASWTEQAEYTDEEGARLRGRAAIEQVYAHLFEERPGARIEIEIESIRFPSRDTAIEEGLILLKHPGHELPSSSRYSSFHVREDEQWRTAVSQEWGSTEDRLHDLSWLIGDWSARSKDSEVQLSYAWNDGKSSIEGRFAIHPAGQPKSSGSQRILRDPQSGHLHSWIFDDVGGHGEADWVRDGDRWVLNTVGVTADGTPTTGTNVLTRINDNEYLWRSIERAAGGQALPETAPVKITRIKPRK